jgi:hypothetical protein
MLLGDLGHPRVNSRLVAAILLRDGDVAHWLRKQGVQLAALQREFSDARWPLEPSLGRPGAEEPDVSDASAEIDLWLADLHVGLLGDRVTDACLLSAILIRGKRVSAWLEANRVTLDAVEAAFPGSIWPDTK